MEDCGVVKEKLWRINCMEDKFPCLWRHWYQNQCVAVGWTPKKGYKLKGGKKNKGWNVVKNQISKMERGDYIIVYFKNSCIGRLGEITDKAIDDDKWDPLVPISDKHPSGEMGRRINVRWDLKTGPLSQDLIIKLPKDKRSKIGGVRGTISEIKSFSIKELKKVMNNEKNWLPLTSKFSYEKSLSDYIARYPYILEEGLLPYPDKKLREAMFPDKSRADVLLLDAKERPVIVECKQNTPTEEHIEQILGYQEKLHNLIKKPKKDIRMIIIHGGAQIIPNSVFKEAKKSNIEIYNYRLYVDLKKYFSS